jgi:hypothetical protein
MPPFLPAGVMPASGRLFEPDINAGIITGQPECTENPRAVKGIR